MTILSSTGKIGNQSVNTNKGRGKADLTPIVLRCALCLYISFTCCDPSHLPLLNGLILTERQRVVSSRLHLTLMVDLKKTNIWNFQIGRFVKNHLHFFKVIPYWLTGHMRFPMSHSKIVFSRNTKYKITDDFW